MFQHLDRLLETDPDAYDAEVARMRREDPERLAAFVDHLREELTRARAEEDRPMTPEEYDEIVSHTAKQLGWPRRRVLAESVLRLRSAAATEDFEPMTPEEPARSQRALRRYSSMHALLKPTLP